MPIRYIPSTVLGDGRSSRVPDERALEHIRGEQRQGAVTDETKFEIAASY